MVIVLLYYYDKDDYLEDFDDTKSLKEKLIPLANQHKQNLAPHFQNLHTHWSRKNTFGYVFTDFKIKPKGLLIGKGESALFEKIKDHYNYLMLCENLTGKFHPVDVNGHRILQVNILKYREIFQKAGTVKKLVDLFLDKPTPDEIEIDAVRDFLQDPTKIRDVLTTDLLTTYLQEHVIKNKDEFSQFLNTLISLSEKEKLDFTIIEKVLPMFVRSLENYEITDTSQIELLLNNMINLFEQYDVKNPEFTSKILELTMKLVKNKKIEKIGDIKQLHRLSSLSDSLIVDNLNLFENTLEDFYKKINDNTSEDELRDFIFENIWILDFKYMDYVIAPKEYSTFKGDLDITLHKNNLNTSSLVIAELKKSNKDLVSNSYRSDKPTLRYEVTSAISQTMHYIQSMKKPYRIIEGYVIVGRKQESKDEFIDVFNSFLHGIKIVTYTELYANAKKIIKAFKEPSHPVPKTTNEFTKELAKDLNNFAIERNIRDPSTFEN